MAYIQGARSLTKIGIVGSGQIGPDIALHFTKVLHEYGVPVVVVDIALEALAAGLAKLVKKIDKGVETKAFKPDQAEAMKANVTFTGDYEALRGSSLVIEAASEDAGLKRRIFAHVEELAAPDAILASNSSHLEPERIFENAKDRNSSPWPVVTSVSECSIVSSLERSAKRWKRGQHFVGEHVKKIVAAQVEGGVTRGNNVAKRCCI